MPACAGRPYQRTSADVGVSGRTETETETTAIDINCLWVRTFSIRIKVRRSGVQPAAARAESSCFRPAAILGSHCVGDRRSDKPGKRQCLQQASFKEALLDGPRILCDGGSTRIFPSSVNWWAAPGAWRLVHWQARAGRDGAEKKTRGDGSDGVGCAPERHALDPLRGRL